MSIKAKNLHFGNKKWISKKNSFNKQQQKAPAGFELTGCTDHMTETLSTRLWSKLHVVVNKILLMKQNFVSIRCQQFWDDVLFHLKYERYFIFRPCQKIPTHALSPGCGCPAVDSEIFDTSLRLLIVLLFFLRTYVNNVYVCSCFIYYVLLWPTLYL